MNINRYAPLFQVVTISSHTFMPHMIGGQSVVVDLGANRGEFCRAVVEQFHPARCIAVEPTPRLNAALKSCPGLDVLACAVGGKNEPVVFHVSDHSESSSLFGGNSGSATTEVTVEGRTLDQILTDTAIDRVDLLKVDIEGAEMPLILESPEDLLRRIGQITVEFHDFCGIISREDVARMVARLESLDFYSMRFSRNNTNWLFVQRTAPGFSAARASVARNVTAGLRRLKHLLG